MSANTLNRPRRQSKSVPTPVHDGPSVEDLRIRAVLARGASPSIASVIAGLAFAVPETWGNRA